MCIRDSYNTATCEASDGTETMDPGADQQTARGEAGFYRGFKNPNLPTTEFGWEIDPMGFRATIREMYSRYRLPMIVTENGLGAYDKLTEDGKVHDQYLSLIHIFTKRFLFIIFSCQNEKFTNFN